jgi:hypothetical protein
MEGLEYCGCSSVRRGGRLEIIGLLMRKTSTFGLKELGKTREELKKEWGLD